MNPNRCCNTHAHWFAPRMAGDERDLPADLADADPAATNFGVDATTYAGVGFTRQPPPRHKGFTTMAHVARFLRALHPHNSDTFDRFWFRELGAVAWLRGSPVVLRQLWEVTK